MCVERLWATKKQNQKQETLGHLYECRVVRKATMIVDDSSHVVSQYYNTLRSGRQFRVSKTKTDQNKVLYLRQWLVS